MKKILLILLLTIVSLDAKSCMTDIYFGNGVWNDSDSAEKNMLKLRRHMHNRAFTPLDREKEGEGGDYNFKYTHNPSHGTIYDLIETFWQLKESGQITEQDFHSYYAGLLSSRDGKHYHERLQQTINTYNADINTMLNQYIDSSFSQKHNVLLMAHSQGNLFGNKIYTLLSDAQKKKFRMVSVATPANHVMEENQISPYVTASGDLVIKSIPGHLDANVDGIGHAFIGTYLHSSFGARTKIAQDVKSAYDDLMQTTTCTEYKFTRVTMPAYGELKIEGRVTYANFDEEIGTIALEQRDATWSASQNKYICGDNDSKYKDAGPIFGHNYWASNGARHDKWLPGTIESKSILDSRSHITDDIILNQKCVTVSLKEGGELYDLIEASVSP